MNFIDENLYMAAALLPTLKKLNDAGVLAIGTFGNSIQISNKLFHDVFRTWTVDDCRRDGLVEHHHQLAGADFFCLAKREEAEADG